MGFPIECGTLGECFEEQRMVLLRRKPRHANKQDIVVMETFSGPPLRAWEPWMSIMIRGNAVWNYAAPWDPVEPLYAARYFLRHGHRNYAAAECVLLNPAASGFNLALRQVVNGVQMRCMIEEHHEWQRIAKHVQVCVDHIRVAVLESAMDPRIHAVIETRVFTQVSDFDPTIIQQMIEVASLSRSEGDDYRFIALTV